MVAPKIKIRFCRTSKVWQIVLLGSQRMRAMGWNALVLDWAYTQEAASDQISRLRGLTRRTLKKFLNNRAVPINI